MLPELDALNDRPSVIRIPHQIDVPVTPRIRRLVDSVPFQRLARISQLGLVAFVYPGANHTRFEHSLGVYRNVLLFIRRLHHFEIFRQTFSENDIESLLVAALLHDIGHWPYCHPIEDMDLEGIPKHESLAADTIANSELLDKLQSDWSACPMLVSRLIQGKPNDNKEKLLCSILSGPIDIDKMDYLYRDSLHCGVPYGMNFDAPRLINTIGINHANDGIAISTKGKTAAEMMVFARYVMFSEVYWHHAVRSATVMLQRLFFRWHQQHGSRLDFRFLRRLDDRSFVDVFHSDSILFNGLFGSKRRLYKRVLDYNESQHPEIFGKIAHQSYAKLTQLSDELCGTLSVKFGLKIEPDQLIIDAPPPDLEVQFKVEVFDSDPPDSLENISPVVNALAKKQFDHYVKRVRIFAHPEIHDKIDSEKLEASLIEATEKCDFKSKLSL